jgi:hypothetical protein
MTPALKNKAALSRTLQRATSSQAHKRASTLTVLQYQIHAFKGCELHVRVAVEGSAFVTVTRHGQAKKTAVIDSQATGVDGATAAAVGQQAANASLLP